MRAAAVVIVNWNGWADTLECLESVLRSEDVDLQVVVCDNGSTDGSLDRIQAWADGRLAAPDGAQPAVRVFVDPPLPKPVPYVRYDRAQAERGGDERAAAARLVLVEVGSNLGFAGGTNVGLRFALAGGRAEAVWLLNNDTVVRPDTLRRLLDAADDDPQVGIVGSTLLYYDDPATVQALGGARYNRWLALPRHVGDCSAAGDVGKPGSAGSRMDYVVGASMLVTRRFLEQVGLLSEEYFLYFEELDWAMRARGRFSLAYAPGSVVYHKEGRSVGSGTRSVSKSATADYHFMRNRIVVTRKFQPFCLPTVYFALGVAMLRRARRGEWDRVRSIARLCWST